MAKIKQLEILKFRSIKQCDIGFPENMPVILFGQNNAGKSNIIRALSIILGEQYPKTISIDDSDFFMRDHSQPIQISVEFDSLLAGCYTKLRWLHERNRKADPTSFEGVKIDGSIKWPSNEQRDDCIAIFIGAERNLNYQLSYSSKYTMLSKLMHRFHEALHDHEDIKKELEKQFSDTKKIFEKLNAFKIFSQSLREDFCTALECWSYKLDIDFEAYNPLNFFHALRVQAKEEQNVRSLEELGSGEQQILAISFAHAYAKAFRTGFVLAIEEPEAHLHPLAQKWLSGRIEQMCKDGLQIILSTHSAKFLNILNMPGMYLVYKDNGITKIKNHTANSLTDYCVRRGADKVKCDYDTILPFYSANTTNTIMEGFFARAIVLVEGPTESLALPEYLTVCGCDLVKLGIAIIAVWGKGNISRYIRLFEAYGIPTFAIFDNDPKDDDSGKKRKAIVETMGEEITDDFLGIDEIYVGKRMAIFGTDFEQTVRRLFNPEYEALETSVILEFGPAKPIVAREVAKIIAGAYNDSTIWDSFRKLALAITELASKTENDATDLVQTMKTLFGDDTDTNNKEEENVIDTPF